MNEPEMSIRPAGPDDADWIRRRLVERWGQVEVAAQGRLFRADLLPALVAFDESGILGLVSYRFDGARCEVITLDSYRERCGVGSRLLEAVGTTALEMGCSTVGVVTTNDNLRALRFYQRRGFRLLTVHPRALARARRLKPGIPTEGAEGIPLRDELELEWDLTAGSEDSKQPGWVVYMLKCADDSLYTGITNNLGRRVAQHNQGKGSRYTRARTPVTLVYAETAEHRSQATRREARIKRLTRAQKLQLIF